MYIIQEIQTENNTTALLPAVTKTDRNEAEIIADPDDVILVGTLQ